MKIKEMYEISIFFLTAVMTISLTLHEMSPLQLQLY